MPKKIAKHYGQLELIPGSICESYVLNDGSSVITEHGVAELVGISLKALQDIAANGFPVTLKPFILNKNISTSPISVKVTAKNSPKKGKKVTVYEISLVESLISGYALAFANNALLPNQKAIGERCFALSTALVKTALDASMNEAVIRE
jgi:hypothetical protein